MPNEGVVIGVWSVATQLLVGSSMWTGFTGFTLLIDRLKGSPFVFRSVFTAASRALFLALALFSVFVIAESRVLLIRFAVTDSYAPRAVDILTWSLFVVFLLAPVFGSRLLPAVAMLYGFEEMLWNTLFNLRNPNDPALTYLSSPYWNGFFVAMIAAFVVGFFLSQKSFRFRWSWWSLVPIAYIIFDFTIGMPVGASIQQTLAHPFFPYNYVYEWPWQISYLSLAWLNLKPSA